MQLPHPERAARQSSWDRPDCRAARPFAWTHFFLPAFADPLSNEILPQCRIADRRGVGTLPARRAAVARGHLREECARAETSGAMARSRAGQRRPKASHARRRTRSKPLRLVPPFPEPRERTATSPARRQSQLYILVIRRDHRHCRGRTSPRLDGCRASMKFQRGLANAEPDDFPG